MPLEGEESKCRKESLTKQKTRQDMDKLETPRSRTSDSEHNTDQTKENR